MNGLRRRIVVASPLMYLTGHVRAGLTGLLDKVTGRAGRVHIILIDNTGSITDLDRGLYRDAAMAELKTAKPGDRLVVAKISDAKLGGFRAAEDALMPISGKHYDDLAKGKKALASATTAVEALIVPVNGGKETRILDVISAVQPLITEATGRKQQVRLLMLTDAVEETQEVNMATSTVDDAWTNKVMATRQRANLLPRLHGIEVYMVGCGGRTATQVKGIEAFWTRYWSTTGAQLKFYGRTVPAFE